jgi:dihydroorotase-like cyclic amidohydrolase
MAWSFEGTILPAGEPGRVVVGAAEVQPLPGRYALPGLVDAHCHLTVAFDQHRPSLDPSLTEPRLGELAGSGVTTIRDVGGDRAVTLTREAPRPGRPLDAGQRPSRAGLAESLRYLLAFGHRVRCHRADRFRRRRVDLA